MLGAIIGDIVGSRFEFNNIKTKDFEFLPRASETMPDGTPLCWPTDDSYMTLAIAEAILEYKKDATPDLKRLSALAVQKMQAWGQAHPASYGGYFSSWLYAENPQPYNSYGNGAAMRVSACGFVAQTLEEAKALSKSVTRVTHNHPEGLKGAEATTVAIFMARNAKAKAQRAGHSKDAIKAYIREHYYPLDFTLDEVRPFYTWNETCQGSVPQALECFFESTDFEDTIRNAISLGGDSDTIAAIAGAVAEAYYGIPQDLQERAREYLDKYLIQKEQNVLWDTLKITQTADALPR